MIATALGAEGRPRSILVVPSIGENSQGLQSQTFRQPANAGGDHLGVGNSIEEKALEVSLARRGDRDFHLCDLFKVVYGSDIGRCRGI